MDNFGSNGSGINGFPSGHTSAVFVLAITLAIYLKNNLWSILFFLGAILAGYSRIYPAQHFPADVLLGSITGTIFAGLSVVLIESTDRTRLFRKEDHKLQALNDGLPPTAIS